jgi:hypothetical protein
MLLSKLVMLRGEVAIAHRLSWNQSRKRDALALILLFAVEVKKSLAHADRTAEGAAKLIRLNFSGETAKKLRASGDVLRKNSNSDP